MKHPFLKSKIIDVDGIKLEITQLSGLDRYNFMSFCSDLHRPEQPQKVTSDASSEEIERYNDALDKWLKEWKLITFKAMSRLLAYGLYRNAEYSEKTIEQVHQILMQEMPEDLVEEAHNKVAELSGMPLPSRDESSTSDNASEQEVFDAKKA